MSDEEANDTSAELDALEAEAAAEEEGPRDGEYQPGGAEEQAEAMSSAEVCTMLASATFAVVASRQGAHWALGDDEAQQLGEAYGALMDKYLPETTAGPELAAVMVTATVVMPRAMQDRAAKAQETNEDETEDGQ